MCVCVYVSVCVTRFFVCPSANLSVSLSVSPFDVHSTCFSFTRIYVCPLFRLSIHLSISLPKCPFISFFTSRIYINHPTSFSTLTPSLPLFSFNFLSLPSSCLHVPSFCLAFPPNMITYLIVSTHRVYYQDHVIPGDRLLQRLLLLNALILTRHVISSPTRLRPITSKKQRDVRTGRGRRRNMCGSVRVCIYFHYFYSAFSFVKRRNGWMDGREKSLTGTRGRERKGRIRKRKVKGNRREEN